MVKEPVLMLASESQRRKDILKAFGIPFEACGSHVAERIVETDPVATVMALAFEKAREVSGRHPDRLVLGADTVVFTEKVLGKPETKAEARRMLQAISGRTHRVYTGVALVGNGMRRIYYECSKVSIRSLTDREIDAYIETGEPMGKAGGYAVQGIGSALVLSVEGDYFNVVGLPVGRLTAILDHMGG